MHFPIRLQLSFLFFLEFFIWGAWFVTMGTFLSQEFSASGGQLGKAYETQSIGAIIAPFVIGLIADRYFAAQKILGILHLIGAALLFTVSNAESFEGFYSLKTGRFEGKGILNLKKTKMEGFFKEG